MSYNTDNPEIERKVSEEQFLILEKNSREQRDKIKKKKFLISTQIK